MVFIVTGYENPLLSFENLFVEKTYDCIKKTSYFVVNLKCEKVLEMK